MIRSYEHAASLGPHPRPVAARCLGLAICLGLAVCLGLAAPAQAFLPYAGEDYQIAFPGDQFTPVYDMNVQDDLAAGSPAWERFATEVGSNWRAFYWNAANDLPHFAAGAPIPVLAAGTYSSEEVSARSQEFLGRIADLTRVAPADLRFRELTVRDERAYAFFDQYYQGLPVFTGQIELHYWHGGVNAITAELYPDVRVALEPRLDETAAAQAARADMPWDPASDALSGVTLGILPLVWDAEIGYFLAYEVRFTTAHPPGDWVAYVDAHDGEVYWRENRVSWYTITGTARGDVKPRRADDAYEDLPMVDQRVVADGRTAYTDDSGDFVVTVTNNQYYTVTDYSDGYFVRVYDERDGQYSALTTSASPGDPAEFYWADANTYSPERSCYYHTNLVHSWLKSTDPDWTQCDTPITCRVNVDCTCNGYYSGSTINFCAEGGGCNNIGEIADVIYHEYQHWVTTRTYNGNPPSNSTGLGEAYSDYCAMTIANDFCMSPSFYVSNPDGCLRTGMNLRQYPGTECGGQEHCMGEITMGSLWKTRRNMIAKHGEGIVPQMDRHFRDAIVMRPRTIPTMLTDLLLANDDNGDLADGTPDYWEICDAWDEHNVPCPTITRRIAFAHTPLSDTEDVGTPILVTASITTEGGAGTIVEDSTKVFYSFDGIEYVAAPMDNVGGSTYQGYIPPTAGRVCDYYIRSVTNLGVVGTEPMRAPERYTHRFLVGAAQAALTDNLEQDLGWTIGAPDDDATDGRWERVDPVGKQYNTEWVQPENDHTAGSGVRCFVTDGRGGYYTNYDVDAGKTSVISPPLDLSAGGDGYVEFYAFLANFGPINDDSLMVFISPDGGDWSRIWEIHGQGWNNPSYVRAKVYFRSAQCGASATARIKIVAEDNENNTLTEAAVDDIGVWVAGAGAGTEETPRRPLAFWAAPASPSPFSGATAIRFRLPDQERVSLRIHDVGGRLVRSLVDGELPAGPHVRAWDGRTSQGRAAVSGVYYYTLTAGSEEITRPLILAR